MECVSCQENIQIIVALENSLFSWPEMQTIWYKCTNCKQGNHIYFSDGEIGQIRMLGAPGPNWETINKERAPTINIRKDPKYLHIWYQGKHYEVKARS